jgi:hypothetical protein
MDGHAKEVLRRLDEHGALLGEHDARLIDLEENKKGGTMAGEAASEQTVDAEVKTPWGTLGGKNLAINTIVTLAILCGVIYIGVKMQAHTDDAKTAGAVQIDATKDQTRALVELHGAIRENNCLQGYQGPPDQKASFCKQVTR